ncbi:MAG: hypothetical protein QW328_06965 [Nitrososphaerota archaeon]
MKLSLSRWPCDPAVLRFGDCAKDGIEISFDVRIKMLYVNHAKRIGEWQFTVHEAFFADIVNNFQRF